ENTEEDGEYIPVNLVSLNLINFRCDTILHDCIYWDCFKSSSFELLVSDGINIFKYNINTKEKNIIYTVSNDQVRVSKLVEFNDRVYFIETDYNDNTYHFYSLESGNVNNIYTTKFSEYEFPEVSLKLIDRNIVCLFQFELCIFNVDTNKFNLIQAGVSDFAISNTSIIYLTYPDNKSSKNTMYEYKFDNSLNIELKDYPFTVSNYNLHTRCIDSINEVYYYNGKIIYLYSSSHWKKEDDCNFIIFKNNKVTVFFNRDGFYVTIQ
ncbi:MAG: hypothetical protein RR837_07800, partial [Bacteroidales bacterium]